MASLKGPKCHKTEGLQSFCTRNRNYGFGYIFQYLPASKKRLQKTSPLHTSGVQIGVWTLVLLWGPSLVALSTEGFLTLAVFRGSQAPSHPDLHPQRVQELKYGGVRSQVLYLEWLLIWLCPDIWVHFLAVLKARALQFGGLYDGP